MIQDVHRLQGAIPALGLAIQIDAAIKFAYLEYKCGGFRGHLFEIYFPSVKEGVLQRISKLSLAVHQDVQLGFYLCYGDRFQRVSHSELAMDIRCNFFIPRFRKTDRTRLIWIH